MGLFYKCNDHAHPRPVASGWRQPPAHANWRRPGAPKKISSISTPRHCPSIGGRGHPSSHAIQVMPSKTPHVNMSCHHVNMSCHNHVMPSIKYIKIVEPKMPFFPNGIPCRAKCCVFQICIQRLKSGPWIPSHHSGTVPNSNVELTNV